MGYELYRQLGNQRQRRRKGKGGAECIDLEEEDKNKLTLNGELNNFYIKMQDFIKRIYQEARHSQLSWFSEVGLFSVFCGVVSFPWFSGV